MFKLSLIVLPLLTACTVKDNSAEWSASSTPKASEARFARAAQAVCGINGAWERIDAVTIQCFTHRVQAAGKAVPL